MQNKLHAQHEHVHIINLGHPDISAYDGSCSPGVEGNVVEVEDAQLEVPELLVLDSLAVLELTSADISLDKSSDSCASTAEDVQRFRRGTRAHRAMLRAAVPTGQGLTLLGAPCR